jgi:microcystin-dependent protein
MGFYTFSTTAASNTAVDGVGSQGSNRANLIDDIARALMASAANFVRDLGGANTVGGSADAATITLADATTASAYFDGMILSYRVSGDNTITNPTLQVDGIATPRVIKKCVDGAETALAAGDLKSGMTAMVVYRSAWASAAGAFELLNPNRSSDVPAGAVMPYAGTTEPDGWLLAYGQAVSRTTYANLYAAIGTTYGVGDGSTTFTLPDLRGRVVAGQDDMGGSSANRLTNQSGGLNGDTLGATGGAETHTLTTAELAVHSHGVTDPGHFHTLTQQVRGTSMVNQSGGNDNGIGAITPATDSKTTGITINNAGSGSAHNNVQPTIILNYIIKT